MRRSAPARGLCPQRGPGQGAPGAEAVMGFGGFDSPYLRDPVGREDAA